MTNNYLKTNNETQVNNLGFLFGAKWLFSFLWPIRLVKTDSGFEHLELVLYQGKVLLNSKTANYSNGNLQLAYRHLFREVDFDLRSRSTALVLGFGLGGVSRLIHKGNSSMHQIGVERNPVIIEWYKLYQKLVPNVEVVTADAADFVSSVANRFDFIVVDLYTDLSVPPQFQSRSFLVKLSSLLSIRGTLVFNKVIITNNQKEEANQLMLDLSSIFKTVRTNDQLDMNRFFIANK